MPTPTSTAPVSLATNLVGESVTYKTGLSGIIRAAWVVDGDLRFLVEQFGTGYLTDCTRVEVTGVSRARKST